MVDLRDIERDEGLTMPCLLETAPESAKRTEEVMTMNVKVNPKLGRRSLTSCNGRPSWTKRGGVYVNTQWAYALVSQYNLGLGDLEIPPRGA